MANNVYTVMSIESTKKSIEQLTNLLHSEEIENANWQEKSGLLTDKLFKLLYEDYPENPTREWMTDNIGAKWCWIHDWSYGEDYIDLTFESAWHTPEDLFHELAEFMDKTLKDTFSNVGSEILIEDEYEITYPDDEDEKYKGKDELYDEDLQLFWDHINDVKDNLIEECRIMLKETIDKEENTEEQLETSS